MRTVVSVIAFAIGLCMAPMAGGPSGLAPAMAQGTVAQDARLGGDRDRTRFVADLSEEVDFRVFTLADPYRVIVDLPDVSFQLSAGLGSEGRGLVSAYRYGLFAPGKSRIVLDVVEPVEVQESFILPPADGQPARLVIEMAKTDRANFLASVNGGRSDGASERAQAAPPVGAPSAGPPRADSGKRTVVLDPGHGGVDPGAVSPSGLTEKEVVFEFAKVLRDKLRATGDYKVLMTREIDTFVTLADRVDFARRNDAELFVSIHADSVPRRYASAVSGATVFTLSEKASDEEARALAAKENRADIIAGVQLPPEEDDVTGILIDLAQRETKNLSAVFAKELLEGLEERSLTGRRPRRSAGFRVLKAPDVPSVLLEIGYISNPEDEKRLRSNEWRRDMAAAVAKAVDKYFAQRVARMPF